MQGQEKQTEKINNDLENYRAIRRLLEDRHLKEIFYDNRKRNIDKYLANLLDAEEKRDYNLFVSIARRICEELRALRTIDSIMKRGEAAFEYEEKKERVIAAKTKRRF